MSRPLFALALAFTLSGCIAWRTQTPPDTLDGVGGPITARQIDDHTWRIYWSGADLFEDEPTREDYFLYRAAQFTVQQGFDWFSITGQHVQMFKGIPPPDVLGTYDARTLMQFVGPRVVPKAALAQPPQPSRQSN